MDVVAARVESSALVALVEVATELLTIRGERPDPELLASVVEVVVGHPALVGEVIAAAGDADRCVFGMARGGASVDEVAAGLRMGGLLEGTKGQPRLRSRWHYRQFRSK